MQEQVRDSHPRRDGIAAPGFRSGTAKARIVLLQTQAEAAGAQEISRILGAGLAALGYEVHHGFFFRRTAAYDAQPNTFFCTRERPTSSLQVARMFMALVRHLKELQPDAVVCFSITATSWERSRHAWPERVWSLPIAIRRSRTFPAGFTLSI